MYLADYHVHSRISPDASASMQEMAEAAIRLGFQEICFSRPCGAHPVRHHRTPGGL